MLSVVNKLTELKTEKQQKVSAKDEKRIYN